MTGLSFEEVLDSNEVQALNLQDPDMGFADVEYENEEADQRWSLIRLNGAAVGLELSPGSGRQEVSLFAVTDIAYQFWKKTLEGFTWSEDGDVLRITRHPETPR